MLTGLSLRLRIFLFFAALGLGALAAIVLGAVVGFGHVDAAPTVVSGFVQAAAIAGFAVVGLVAAVWYLFDTHVAKPIDILSGALRARAHADISGDLDHQIARYLGDLAPAAAATAHSLSETRDALAEAVARETARLSDENARLETLLADVGVGVLLCSAEHRLAFYNGLGNDLLRAEADAGLDHSLFDYLRDGPILHAYARLVATGDVDATSDLMCSTRDGAQIMAARMRLLPGAGKPGYVLTLRDVTADIETLARRDALMRDMLDQTGRPSANLAALLDVVPSGAQLPAAIDTALRDEVQKLRQATTAATKRYDALRREGWPMTLTRASDLADGLTARLQSDGKTIEHCADPLLLRCNGFEIIGLMAALAHHLPAPDIAVSITEDGGEAMLRLSWTGNGLAISQLEAWLDTGFDQDGTGLTGRQVLTRHGSDIWPETTGARHSLCMPISVARRENARPTPVPRPVVYDFDLLSPQRAEGIAKSRLDALTYVVFDTETTGLLPQQGDEIVQIAAVRIVNGQRVRAEIFDTLVNPNRNIPARSTAVHGITEAMVADAPTVAEALRRFHAFAKGAVLIAHNAPFDMQFLRRTEAEIGLTFDHPILDTVLLSAVIWGQHETHSLDALTHRLGITIPEEVRHTALGDAVATADAYVKLLPMLHGKGLDTFAEVLTELRRHGRLLKDLNA